MTTMIFETIRSLLFIKTKGQTQDNPLTLKAVPGLMTVVDQALYRSNEGQLTATICSSHALLACWLDTKHQAQSLLQSLAHHDVNSSIKTKHLCESFARQCLDISMDAIERLSTDNFAQSANLTDPYDSLSAQGGHGTSNSHVLSGVGIQGIATGVLESKNETCRRAPIMQQRKDCWESPRLFCPDYVWADDAYIACQRWLRSLAKHPYAINEADPLNPLKGNESESNLSRSSERHASILRQLVQEDLPVRLYQFHQAMEANAIVTKRLYLVKSEYRAPFRAFLEAHQSLLKAPPLELVESCLSSSKSQKGENLEETFQALLKEPALVELLALERELEQLEQDIAQHIYAFTELARTLDHRKARLKTVPGVIEKDQLVQLETVLRHLKCVLCRKGGTNTSTGIRPILLDLQGFPRDDEVQGRTTFPSQNTQRYVDDFLWYLKCLSILVKRKRGFVFVAKNNSSTPSSGGGGGGGGNDFNASIIKGCTDGFDSELLKCQLLDWLAMVERQHVLQQEHESLPDRMRQAEIAKSIVGVPEKALLRVKERLEKMQADRQLRLDVFKELLEDLCLREMHLYVDVEGPDPRQTLVLKETSAVGFLGVPLQLAGEPLPLG